MGLLDDAIRDHLDLKRRRGADPAEVERAEREALGPVRRGPEEPQAEAELAPSADPGWDELEPGPAVVEHDDYRPEGDHDPFPDAPHGAGELSARPVPVGEEPAAELPVGGPSGSGGGPPQPLQFTGETPPAHDDPHEPSTAEFFENVPSAQEHLAESAPGGRRGNGETVEYDVERAIDEEPHAPLDAPAPRSAAPKSADPSAQPSPDEDPLQETPEFLSDTPDHDRLWFEQKPPRDFDFDG